MTISVLRTADAWWVKTADRRRQDRHHRDHHRRSCWPTGRPIDAAAAGHRDRPVDSLDAALAGDRAVPGGGPDDQLRVARQRRRHGPRLDSADVLPQGVGVDQRPVRRHRQTRARPAPRLRGGDRPGDRPRYRRSAQAISDANLSDYIAGLVVTNDVSARDIQLPQTQFYEAKSYPTFTPVGPALVLLDADELKRFGDLRLRLSVNGETRQDALVEGDMLYRPLAGAAVADPVPGPRRRRSDAHRHAGRHRAERPAQAHRDHRQAAAAGRQVEGVLQTPGRQPQVPPATATSSRRRSPPTTAPSTSEPSAPQSRFA